MMAWMEMDYNMDFYKLSRMNFFQIFKFGLEIFKIFGKKVAAIRNSFRKLLSIIYLELFILLFHKFREQFLR